MKLSAKSKIISKSSKLNATSIIYFLISKKRIVYIGKSKRGFLRIMNHYYMKKIKFDSFSTINCKAKDLCGLEMEYITKFKPKHNNDLHLQLVKKH